MTISWPFVSTIILTIFNGISWTELKIDGPENRHIISKIGLCLCQQEATLRSKKLSDTQHKLDYMTWDFEANLFSNLLGSTC
jgi:hypothetical protein